MEFFANQAGRLVHTSSPFALQDKAPAYHKPFMYAIMHGRGAAGRHVTLDARPEIESGTGGSEDGVSVDGERFASIPDAYCGPFQHPQKSQGRERFHRSQPKKVRVCNE
jgi:hypothetical protein